MKTDLIFELLNRALTEELGLVITTNNPQSLKSEINLARQDIDRYKSLNVVSPTTPNTLIIQKATVQLETLPDDFYD